jgi:sugar lactone lactonase YvrE
MMHSSKLELVADYSCNISENPLWHPTEKKLYWTDIPTGRLFRYDPATSHHEQIYTGRPVGGFTFDADGGLLLFMDRGAIVSWRDGNLIERLAEIPAEQNSRFNDVIADPAGRVFCGTMSTASSKGRLYRLDIDGSLHAILEGIGCSNGMAFTLDCKGFYYTDSFAREIYLFDYDAANGSISNQRIFAKFSQGQGMPDGITLDADGFVWAAFWDGGCIMRFDPEGNIIETIQCPAPKITSLTFGGDNLNDIYITSAGGHEKHVEGPSAGALFRIARLHQGLPERYSRIQAPSYLIES